MGWPAALMLGRGMNRPVAPFRMTGFDYLLYAGIIWGWSTSWYAMRFQLGIVSPEVSVFWRFLGTAPLMFALAAWRGETWRMPLTTHVGLFLTGIFMFSSNFILIYYVGTVLPSGLVAVVFSLSSVINLGLGVLVFGERFRWKLALGGLLGVVGVAFMFASEIGKMQAGTAPLWGLAVGIGGTLLFSIGNQISARLQKNGVRVLPAAAWGMVYGTIWAGCIGLFNDRPFQIPLTPDYLGSLAFLILSATILAFYTYLTLVGRIGPARASYATVIFPIFALLISTVLESYVWTPLAMIGLALALAGNLLVLRRDMA